MSVGRLCTRYVDLADAAETTQAAAQLKAGVSCRSVCRRPSVDHGGVGVSTYPVNWGGRHLAFRPAWA
jgi:hypothetical protein